jgi:ATP-dependent Lhr-like helicase
VWAGEVTNDTLEPLNSLIYTPQRSESARDRLRSGRPLRNARARLPGSEGRWSLRKSRWSEAIPETERRAALARTLLERYGVVTREAAQAESIPGGFSSVYEVLKAMEDAARVRRGYFVAEHGATQFALPGADERLRAKRLTTEATTTLVLAAVDPANPYGAILPWPTRANAADGGRFSRSAGAYVIIHEGALIGYLPRGGQTLFTIEQDHLPLPQEAVTALAKALAKWAAISFRRAFLLSAIDNVDAAQHHFARAFTEAGFNMSGKGLLLRSASRTRETLEEEPA